ncbi:MAG: OmpH family outer membrane protein [Tannerella sp.]|jgi:outer membrane protein|nr:OmpH family outer membrane protein [Tannerella sp.]
MKNINYLINGILALAVIVLFILYFSGNKKAISASGTTEVSLNETTALPVAYINVDSLLSNYNYSKDLMEQLTRKQENARANFTQQARNLQSEVDNFQYKLKNSAFATQERAEQEQQRLMRKQQELQALDEKLSQDVMEEAQRVNQQLRDTIIAQLREFNKDKGYQLIISNNGGNPILITNNDAYNITDEVTEYLNKRWSGGSGD